MAKNTEQEKEQEPPLVQCTVLVQGTQVGSMKLAKGLTLPLKKSLATELESQQKVKIIGVAV